MKRTVSYEKKQNLPYVIAFLKSTLNAEIINQLNFGLETSTVDFLSGCKKLDIKELNKEELLSLKKMAAINLLQVDAVDQEEELKDLIKEILDEESVRRKGRTSNLKNQKIENSSGESFDFDIFLRKLLSNKEEEEVKNNIMSVESTFVVGEEAYQIAVESEIIKIIKKRDSAETIIYDDNEESVETVIVGEKFDLNTNSLKINKNALREIIKVFLKSKEDKKHDGLLLNFLDDACTSEIFEDFFDEPLQEGEEKTLGQFITEQRGEEFLDDVKNRILDRTETAIIESHENNEEAKASFAPISLFTPISFSKLNETSFSKFGKLVSCAVDNTEETDEKLFTIKVSKNLLDSRIYTGQTSAFGEWLKGVKESIDDIISTSTLDIFEKDGEQKKKLSEIKQDLKTGEENFLREDKASPVKALLVDILISVYPGDKANLRDKANFSDDFSKKCEEIGIFSETSNEGENPELLQLNKLPESVIEALEERLSFKDKICYEVGEIFSQVINCFSDNPEWPGESEKTGTETKVEKEEVEKKIKKLLDYLDGGMSTLAKERITELKEELEKKSKVSNKEEGHLER